jgi:hypothetical protein
MRRDEMPKNSSSDLHTTIPDLSLPYLPEVAKVSCIKVQLQAFLCINLI